MPPLSQCPPLSDLVASDLLQDPRDSELSSEIIHSGDWQVSFFIKSLVPPFSSFCCRQGVLPLSVWVPLTEAAAHVRWQRPCRMLSCRLQSWVLTWGFPLLPGPQVIYSSEMAGGGLEGKASRKGVISLLPLVHRFFWPFFFPSSNFCLSMLNNGAITGSMSVSCPNS